MKLTRLSLLALLFVVGCKQPMPPGLPHAPGELLASLSHLDKPADYHLEGRLRTTLGGVDMNLGFQLRGDDVGNARMDVAYPFGGHAMTLILRDDGSLFAEAAGAALVLFTPDATGLMQRLVGDWAKASLLLDLFLGRLPMGFDGLPTWDREQDGPMLALDLANGNRALLGVQPRPARLDHMLVMNDTQEVIAEAAWAEWTEVDGYWFPTSIEVDVPGRVGDMSVDFRKVNTNPTGDAALYEYTTPSDGYRTFESFLKE